MFELSEVNCCCIYEVVVRQGSISSHIGYFYAFKTMASFGPPYMYLFFCWYPWDHAKPPDKDRMDYDHNNGRFCFSIKALVLRSESSHVQLG